MRGDMSGAAAVIGTIKNTIALNLKKNVIFALAIAENAIGCVEHRQCRAPRGVVLRQVRPDHPVSPLVPLPPESDLVARQEQARRAEGRAYADLMDAKVRHRPTLEWYGKVSERFRTRLDEEQILSEVRMVLVTGPGLIFYPIVHWNIHSVMWDGTDPDAESDPVTRYCADRLSKPVASAAHPPWQGE